MTEKKVLAWHGDPDLKENTILRMKGHAQQDEFVRRAYVMRDSVTPLLWKGCLHGCLSVENMAMDLGISVVQVISKWWTNDWYDVESHFGDRAYSVWHQATERYFGIPVHIGWQLDHLYENSSEPPGEVAVKILEAIPVGADLGTIVFLPSDLEEVLGILRNAPVPNQEEGQ